MRCLKKRGLPPITKLLHKGQSSAYIPGVHGVHSSYPSVAYEQLSCRCAEMRCTRPGHLAEGFNLSYTTFGSAISTQDGPAAGTLKLSEAWGTYVSFPL
jgi:hypothetical protein